MRSEFTRKRSCVSRDLATQLPKPKPRSQFLQKHKQPISPSFKNLKYTNIKNSHIEKRTSINDMGLKIITNLEKGNDQNCIKRHKSL